MLYYLYKILYHMQLLHVPSWIYTIHQSNYLSEPDPAGDSYWLFLWTTLQSKTTLILLGFLGWYTPWYAIYRISMFNSLLLTKLFTTSSNTMMPITWHVLSNPNDAFKSLNSHFVPKLSACSLSSGHDFKKVCFNLDISFSNSPIPNIFFVAIS